MRTTTAGAALGLLVWAAGMCEIRAQEKIPDAPAALHLVTQWRSPGAEGGPKWANRIELSKVEIDGCKGSARLTLDTNSMAQDEFGGCIQTLKACIPTDVRLEEVKAERVDEKRIVRRFAISGVKVDGDLFFVLTFGEKGIEGPSKLLIETREAKPRRTILSLVEWKGVADASPRYSTGCLPSIMKPLPGRAGRIELRNLVLTGAKGKGVLVLDDNKAAFDEFGRLTSMTQKEPGLVAAITLEEVESRKSGALTYRKFAVQGAALEVEFFLIRADPAAGCDRPWQLLIQKNGEDAGRQVHLLEPARN